VTLTTDVYKDIKISDEELTLDIKNFGLQVLNPVMAGVAETIEDQLIATIQGATYAKSIAFTYSTGNVWKDLILPARELLNKARVPQAGRVLAVGSGIETAMLGTDLFVQAQQSGNTSALEEAVIGRKAGFTIVSVPGLGPTRRTRSTRPRT
jgi:altronate dehydratase